MKKTQLCSFYLVFIYFFLLRNIKIKLLVEDILHETDVFLCYELDDERINVFVRSFQLLFYQLLEIIFDTLIGTTCSHATTSRSSGWRSQFQTNFAVVHVQIEKFFEEITFDNVRREVQINERMFCSNAIENQFGRLVFIWIIQLK